MTSNGRRTQRITWFNPVGITAHLEKQAQIAPGTCSDVKHTHPSVETPLHDSFQGSLNGIVALRNFIGMRGIILARTFVHQQPPISWFKACSAISPLRKTAGCQ